MPELPEVEVVRAGLAPAVTGATVIAAEVRDPRALKRHLPLGVDGLPGDDGLGGHGVTLTPEAGLARSADFERRVAGLRLAAPQRRGKFLWIPIALNAGDGLPSPVENMPSQALLAHLGMSGQLLLRSLDAPDDRHVRIRLWIQHPEHGELRLDFADQRLFGSLALDGLSAAAGGGAIPNQARHIARDPLDPAFDDDAFVAALRSRSAGVKKLLLDQTLVSGVGNIYADEALWRARLHPETAGTSIGPRKARDLLTALRDVFAKALAEGGTSFDAQYVNVNGQAGYFAHSLNAYGRTGEPCPRCGEPIRRVPFGGRSSHFCPRCQRRR
ncbi:bifunctional DNA-formamidopyrimidine glycosylase/DNA-(apurinic or apyrimidinic site) lyase [Leucobacter tenebrionis]|uniref:bifunctional DNA-formamidopyrimidine glycosylase/DNA-(apurinic or apyrimidinic site) lyase n=1 Tax=Leucobacter tenebrionis TaxID=2873270 RepID=UPI001CA6985D|nr:bifunctional DNA-formamidopyrimidine glycosylase/DNA-(apurinic or apyrimidinic site) lyase [Leucobacter tenebrionis]QZY52311.1 bifunctional DNA-formamidopyrimidine glycosylase/DNA-(apurinic or apyrimidinic site) lyase [Leucobacter tenebrionis]